jgi:UDP:flavonoid glycosyltransferase YjiC (YdhE family)
MRFLFTCIPGLGHFHPMVSLARSLEQSGHVVAFATAPAFGGTVTNAGLEFIAAGMDWDERFLLETVPELRAVPKPYRGQWMMNHLFLDRSPRRMVPDLLKIIPAWCPDLIVAGSFEYGGPLAAEKLGIPYANVNYTIRWNRWILKHAVGPAMTRLRADFHLPADAHMTAFGRFLDLCLAPPSWTFENALLRPALARLVSSRILGRDIRLRQRLWGMRALILQRLFARAQRLHPEQGAVGATTHFIRDRDDAAEPIPPAWLAQMPRQPLVLVSLGTVLSAEYPDIFDKLLAGLRDQPINLVMTLGGKDDPARFGPQPANVRIVHVLTQDEMRQLLPHVDLCINHAGYSSVMEALVLGIPLVLLPLVSDAPMNTQMCLSDGVTPDLPPDVWGLSPKGLPYVRAEKLTPTMLRQVTMEALQDHRYRDAARRLQHELARRPGPSEAVRLLEHAAMRRGGEDQSAIGTTPEPKTDGCGRGLGIVPGLKVDQRRSWRAGVTTDRSHNAARRRCF